MACGAHRRVSGNSAGERVVMRSKKMLLFGAAFAALCTNACQKSPAPERKETDRTEVRSGEMTSEPRPKEEITQKNDYLETVRREQLVLRGRLQEDIDDIDKKLVAYHETLASDGSFVVDPRSKEAQQVQELLRRRALLEADVNLIQRSDERGWDEVKAAIEKDLESRPRGKT
jgi:hypothetical protein